MNKDYLRKVAEMVSINIAQLNYLIKQQQPMEAIEAKMDEMKENLRIIQSGLE